MNKITVSDFEVVHNPESELPGLIYSFTKEQAGYFIDAVEGLPDSTVPEYTLTPDNDLQVRFADVFTFTFEGAGNSIDGQDFMLFGSMPDKYKKEDQPIVTLLTKPAFDLRPDYR